MAPKTHGIAKAINAGHIRLKSSPRVTRSANPHLDGVDDEPSGSNKSEKTLPPPKKTSRGRMTRANKAQEMASESGTANGSSGDEVADDEDDETSLDEQDDGDDDSDEPAVYAPSLGSRNHSFRQAGLLSEYQRLFHSDDPVLYEDPNELFGEFNDEVDDDVYQAVDDISDEDEQGDGSSSEHSDMAGSDPQSSDESQSFAHYYEAEHILGHVDGLSDYGFGDGLDSEETTSSSAPSEDGRPYNPVERHVHFDSDVEPLKAYGPFTSPSLSRALLPSALPLEFSSHHSLNRALSREPEDPYDSDATEVTSQPATSVRPTNNTTSRAGKRSISSLLAARGRAHVGKGRQTKGSRRKRGPPRGMFTINKDKSWAVLDSTRTKVLQVPAANTNRHDWLDSITMSLSTPTSPSVEPVAGFINAESVVATASQAEDDLNTPDSYLSHGLQLVGGDYAVSPEPATENDDTMSPVGSEKPEFDLEDFLEGFSSDESEGESQLPLYAPADENLNADNDALACYGEIDLSSFRQYADALARPQPSPQHAFQLSPLRTSHFAVPPAPAKSCGHKRKASSTPYQDEKIYGDVTPVERKVINAPKRRRIATL